MADDTDPELVYDLVVASIRSIFGDNDTKDAKICYISVIGGNDNVTFSGKINKSLKKIGKMVSRIGNLCVKRMQKTTGLSVRS